MQKPFVYHNAPKSVRRIIDIIISEFKKIFGHNLIGIYLHGSLAMGCFNPYYSDIDFLVIVKKKLTIEDKKKIAEFSLKISESKNLSKKGIEFSIILEKYAKNFKYPTPYDFHFSETWQEKYRNNKVDFTAKQKDKDLAAHITVILHKGIVLYGKPIRSVFDKSAAKFYKKSIMYDYEEIRNNPADNPVYEILNLCRILYYIREKKISSKLEGAKWALGVLQEKHKAMIKDALKVYTGKNRIRFDKKRVIEFENFMAKLIESQPTLNLTKIRQITEKLTSKFSTVK